MTSTQKRNLRADTALVVFDVLEKGLSARECLPSRQQGYSEQDKAWLQEMVMGVLRQLPILQFWLRELLDKPLKGRFKIAEHLILVGFYQLVFTRVSTHAAVSETVSAAKVLNVQAMKGLVNAVLRNFIRKEMEQHMPQNAQVTSGLPKWLYKRLAAAYPEQLDTLIPAMQQKAPIWLRVNHAKISTPEYADQLAVKGIEFDRSQSHAQALILGKGHDITTLPGYSEGLFAVQDGAAQLAAQYLDPQPGDRVLDCCAAPGGKTCHLLEIQPELGFCLALDVEASRMTRVEENLQRLGHTAELVVGDASAPDSWWDGQPFDRILLDAPCSATGIVRRHPDIKWLRKGSDIDPLVSLQKEILDAMWRLLKPGGTLLYATCSILPEENRLQVEDFVTRQPDATLVPLDKNQPDVPFDRQIIPGEQQMDGFYYARLLKS